MNRNMLVNSLQVLGMAAALAAGAIAHADAEHAPAVEQRQLTVTYDDLDVSKPADAQRLYGRIERAARNVCGVVDMRNVGQRAAWRACHERAVASAVAAVGSEQLAIIHRARARQVVDTAAVVADARGVN